MKRILSAILLLLGIPAAAQFYSSGNEDASRAWNTFSTGDYRFIYPRGCDSLAFCYALEWQRAKEAVGVQGISDFPVILHSSLAYSNGAVIWSPSRMEMYTNPEMYCPETLPWARMLALHENRHVFQLSFTGRKPFGFLDRVCGELLAGPISTIWADSMFLEGDSVVSETALSEGGRGRTADFLEYIRCSFENGQPRNYYRWRYGSQKLYTPDYYKIGYITIGGLQALWHDPLFTERYFANIADGRLWRPFSLTVRQSTGLSFKQAYSAIADSLSSRWAADTRSRAPFQSSSPAGSHDFGRYTSYSGLAATDSLVLAVRSGMDRNSELVGLGPDGKEQILLRHLNPSSRLCAGPERIYWTECIPHKRFEMQSFSELHYLEKGKVHKAFREHRVYNPKYNEGILSLIENRDDGSAQVLLLREADLSPTDSIPVPAGLQAYESIVLGGEVYICAMNEKGQGIYLLDKKGADAVLEPAPLKVNRLEAYRGRLLFTSDRSGVNELYSLEPHSREVEQLSNLDRGGRDFCFMGNSLYYTVLQPEGRFVYATEADSLPRRKVDFCQRHSYWLADSLSALKAEALERRGCEFPQQDSTTLIPQVQPHNKAANALRLHSFAPFFCMPDALLQTSYQTLSQEAGLGITAYSQNNLGTFSTAIGVGWLTLAQGFAPVAQLDLSYRGFWPVLEAKLRYTSAGFNPLLRAYTPFNLSSGGWKRGIIPIIEYTHIPGIGSLLGSSLRAYTMLPKTASCIYPRWGLGAELTYVSGEMLAGSGSYRLYGYFPGFTRTHGFAFNASLSPGAASCDLSLKYAMPVLPLDCSLFSPAFYLRNFELIPFVQYTRQPTIAEMPQDMKIGASISVVLGNFFFIHNDIHLGVQVSWGSVSKFTSNLVFNVDI